jgi:dGTPase
MKEIWEKLLSAKRLGEPETTKTTVRSQYLIDVDRLIYSTHFRKLQDKTQVHPLSKSDYVRTRLTHSLEVASISRSLGYAVGQHIVEKYQLKGITEHDFGYIAQAAALAHDIGNPPFGHLAEEAINAFFESKQSLLLQQGITHEQFENLVCFDGNSQGFRIITNLAGWKNDGGLKLTFATLGTFLKYPTGFAPSKIVSNTYIKHMSEFVINTYGEKSDNPCIIGTKKTGIMQTELDIFNVVAQDLGLIQLTDSYPLYYRHPLAFLTEGADDIGYCIADLEDAFFVGILDLSEVENILAPIARHPDKYSGDSKERTKTLKTTDFYKKMDSRKKVEWLRGKAISNLISAVVDVFIEHEELILKGKLNAELLSLTPFAEDIHNCKETARTYIFNSHDKITAEIAGITAIVGTLDELLNMILNPAHPKSKRIMNLLENKLIIDDKETLINPSYPFYDKICRIVDIVSDFTDRNLLDFYRMLK